MCLPVEKSFGPEVPGVAISVIIPFYGEKSDLSGCLAGLHNQRCDFPFEVIIVASGCDNEAGRPADSRLKTIFISLDEKIPPGRARNIGCSSSQSDFLAFIDADCVAEPAWLSEIHASLSNEAEIVVGPVVNLLPYHPIASVDNLLLFPDFQKHRPSRNIAQFPGCNFGITKSLFMKTGGFLENIEIGEDTQFSRLAIKKAAGAILFNSRMVVRHRGRKNFMEFMRHQKNFGYHRKYDNFAGDRAGKRFGRSFIYAALFGFRRLLYLLWRTMQWNPIGLFRVIFYFPILILGLFAWVIGFYRQNQACQEDPN
jgi:glycosyltransferase involved in cell wall biosynthesis